MYATQPQSSPGEIPEWTLADRLEKARRHAKIDADELAAYLGLSRRSVTGYEAGERTPRLTVLRDWARRCGVDFEWLAGDDVPDPRPWPGRAGNQASSSSSTEASTKWSLPGAMPELLLIPEAA